MRDGFLNVHKPAGWTSFDVVNFVRRLTRVKRAGHGGTLDPAATGVLPVALGRATRLLEYLGDARKVYLATVVLGVETDTYDAEGRVVAQGDASGVSRADVEAVLPRFLGRIQQAPPPYSAVKRGGRPLYEYARKGMAVEVEPRPVDVYRLDIRSFEPPSLVLEVECGKGTYVRSLAHDIGRALGAGAHLAALVRTRVGPFTLDDAVTPEELRAAGPDGLWWEHLRAPDAFLLEWHAAILGHHHARQVQTGRALRFPNVPPDRYPDGLPCRAYGPDGHLLAVLRYSRAAGAWQPEKVLAAEP